MLMMQINLCVYLNVLEKEPQNLYAVSGRKGLSTERTNDLAINQYCQVATLPSIESKDINLVRTCQTIRFCRNLDK